MEVRREPGRIRHVIRAALDQVIPQVERFVEMGDLRMEIQAAGQDCRTGSLADGWVPSLCRLSVMAPHRDVCGSLHGTHEMELLHREVGDLVLGERVGRRREAITRKAYQNERER